MAGRSPVVNVTILGDATDAEAAFRDTETAASRAFGNVGDDAARMSSRVGDAGRDVGGGLDRVTDGADATEGRVVGLRDAFTGTGDVMAGFKDGNIVQVLSGFADLASSVANFAGPILGQVAARLGITTAATSTATAATEGQTVAQGSLNTVMSLNPIVLVVAALAALAAAFYLAYTRSETFREAVDAALSFLRDTGLSIFEWFREHWPLLLIILTGPFGLAVVGIKNYGDDIVRTVQAVPDKVRTVIDRVKDIITSPFRLGRDIIGGLFDEVAEVAGGVPRTVATTINGVIGLVNRGISAINEATKIDRREVFGVTVFPGFGGLNIPAIPTISLAQGGVVRVPTLAIVGDAGPADPEVVSPLSSLRALLAGVAGGGGNVLVTMPPGITPDEAFDALERYRRRQGLAG